MPQQKNDRNISAKKNAGFTCISVFFTLKLRLTIVSPNRKTINCLCCFFTKKHCHCVVTIEKFSVSFRTFDDQFFETFFDGGCKGANNLKLMDKRELHVFSFVSIRSASINAWVNAWNELNSNTLRLLFLHHYVSGGFVDTPMYGPAPGPWEIPCEFTALFKNETKKLEVPHTASVTVSNGCK